jgi:CheY-like chemotaxis protein
MARVLVVDDEEYIVDLLSLLLEDDGHTPLRAYNGREALEVVLQERPQLVIADVMMPLMDGEELARIMKGDPKTAHIPLILMSALGSMRRGCPADDFVAKPFDLEMVRRAIEKHLRER